MHHLIIHTLLLYFWFFVGEAAYALKRADTAYKSPTNPAKSRRAYLLDHAIGIGFRWLVEAAFFALWLNPMSSGFVAASANWALSLTPIPKLLTDAGFSGKVSLPAILPVSLLLGVVADAAGDWASQKFNISWLRELPVKKPEDGKG
jgi:hypothetical protein